MASNSAVKFAGYVAKPEVKAVHDTKAMKAVAKAIDGAKGAAKYLADPAVKRQLENMVVGFDCAA